MAELVTLKQNLDIFKSQLTLDYCINSPDWVNLKDTDPLEPDCSYYFEYQIPAWNTGLKRSVGLHYAYFRTRPTNVMDGFIPIHTVMHQFYDTNWKDYMLMYSLVWDPIAASNYNSIGDCMRLMGYDMLKLSDITERSKSYSFSELAHSIFKYIGDKK